jgi:hypothetical protein
MSLSHPAEYEKLTIDADDRPGGSRLQVEGSTASPGGLRELRFGPDDHLEACPDCGASVTLAIGRSGPTFYACNGCKAVGAYFKGAR